MDPAVEQLVRLLDLAPHPEGGWYRETHRSTHCDASGRAAATQIYFLLPRGAVSRLHRIDADEGWHLYLGGPLEVFELDEARPDADFALVGCTVAPAFDFAHFELGERATLLERFPAARDTVLRLTTE